MEQNELKTKIRNRFADLIEQRKGKLMPNMVDRLPPNGTVFAKTAEEIIEYAIELYQDESKSRELFNTLDHDIDYVKRYGRNPLAGDRYSAEKSENTLLGKMKDVLDQIHMELIEIVGDITY